MKVYEVTTQTVTRDIEADHFEWEEDFVVFYGASVSEIRAMFSAAAVHSVVFLKDVGC